MQCIARGDETITVTDAELLRAIRQLGDVNDRLLDVLLRFKKSNRQLVDLVAEGGSVREAMGVEVPQRRRRELTAALDAFEAARHQFRLAIFARCLEEGATISEIGRALGVSRQRASVLAREAAKRQG